MVLQGRQARSDELRGAAVVAAAANGQQHRVQREVRQADVRVQVSLVALEQCAQSRQAVQRLRVVLMLLLLNLECVHVAEAEAALVLLFRCGHSDALRRAI